MNPRTSERLVQAATRLFADAGYRGASVREITNLAGTNPGAVSYHFKGKRHLYRTVLRRAVESVTCELPEHNPATTDVLERAIATVEHIARRLNENPAAARLLLRDLADGGTVAVEALEPALRAAFDNLCGALGTAESPAGRSASRRLFVQLAAPLFLISAAWPVLARSLDLAPEHRSELLSAMLHTLEPSP